MPHFVSLTRRKKRQIPLLNIPLSVRILVCYCCYFKEVKSVVSRKIRQLCRALCQEKGKYQESQLLLIELTFQKADWLFWQLFFETSWRPQILSDTSTQTNTSRNATTTGCSYALLSAFFKITMFQKFSKCEVKA